MPAVTTSRSAIATLKALRRPSSVSTPRIATPNSAQVEMQGKLTTCMVSVTARPATQTDPVVGLNTLAAVTAPTHALGFTNWNAAPSQNDKGCASLTPFTEAPNIFHAR